MKARTRAPRFKIQRRLGVELPGLGKPGALARKPYPPGPAKVSGRPSEYGRRLAEKQKVLFHYGLREEQLRRHIAEAKRGAAGSWIEKLFSRLERRLDSVVFRLGLASSIRAARQLVSHGKVVVNGRRLTIPSAALRPGDHVCLTRAASARVAALSAVPGFLARAAGDFVEAGTLLREPSFEELPFPFDRNLFTEYYSVRGG